MRAVRVTRLDGPGAVELADVETPEPGPGQVLLDVHRAGVTFPEVLQSRGLYQDKPDLPFTPGAEVAGTVVHAPEDSGCSAGDRVAAFTVLGGFAEQSLAPVDLVFPLPDEVSFDVGAALLMNYLTVQFALVRRGRLGAGEMVLVHGAGGGVGTAAVQLAKALGAGVVAVVSSDAKADVARAAGADHVVPADGFRDAVRALTDGHGVDVVVDPVGGDRFTDSLRSLAPEGRLLVIGFAAGDIPTVRVNRLLLNNIDVVGVGWGAFALSRPRFVADQWQALLPYVVSGAVNPPIGATYDLADAGAALAALEDRRATGKVLLRLR